MCAIPRIGSKLGDKEIRSYNKDTLEEENREQVIVEKMKMLRKKSKCEREKMVGNRVFQKFKKCSETASQVLNRLV